MLNIESGDKCRRLRRSLIRVSNKNVLIGFRYPVWSHPDRSFLFCKKIAKVLKTEVLVDDSCRHVLVCVGSSGAFMAGMVAAFMPYFRKERTILYLRKENEKSHGVSNHVKYQGLLEYDDNVKFWFLDDGISSGDTLKYVVENLSRFKEILGDRSRLAGGLVVHFRYGQNWLQDFLEPIGVSEFTLHCLNQS